MKIAQDIETGNPGYVDVDTFITVGNKEWWLRTSLELATGFVSDGDVQVADAPEGDFSISYKHAPGVVRRTYEAMRPKIMETLDMHRPKNEYQSPCSYNHDSGLLTLETGETIDIPAIQKTLVLTFTTTGDNDLAMHADALALLTGKTLDINLEWVELP